MKRSPSWLIWFAAMVVALSHLPGQCCLGAQNTSVLSSNGRYRVEATSLTGTGHQSHGPYHFRFTMYRVAEKARDGKPATKDAELGTFERQWDSRAHFHMQIVVSPTGNGFLFGCPMQPQVQFLGRRGRVLRDIVCAYKQRIDPYGGNRDKTKAQKHSVRLFSGGGGKPSRQIELWLPFGQVVGPELRAMPWRRGSPVTYAPIGKDVQPHWQSFGGKEKRWLLRMLTWSPKRGEHERAAVEGECAKLRAKPSHRAAQDALLELGLSALPVLRAKLVDEQDADCCTAMASVIDRIDARLCGHDVPWRNRELLQVVAEHPDEDLRNCALGRLRALDTR